MDISNLTQFLLDSNQSGYAGGEPKKWIKEADGSTTIPYEKGDFKSHDNFFGGEPYGGSVVVTYQNKAVWMMVYYGWVDNSAEASSVYEVLKNALKLMPADAPLRGPKEMHDGEFIYTNVWTGNVERYAGEEQITQSGKLIYKANYMGGLVDQR